MLVFLLRSIMNSMALHIILKYLMQKTQIYGRVYTCVFIFSTSAALPYNGIYLFATEETAALAIKSFPNLKHFSEISESGFVHANPDKKFITFQICYQV